MSRWYVPSHHRRRWRLLLGGVVVIGILTACSSAPVRRGDVVGTWLGKNGAKLVLHEDGSFQQSGLPMQVILTPALFPEPNFDSGTWSLQPPSFGNPPNVELVVGQTALQAPYIDGHGDGMRLFFWIGDPDEGIRYVMCRPGDSGCSPGLGL